MFKIKKIRMLNLATFMYLLTAYLFAASSLGNILLIIELLLIIFSDSDAYRNVRYFQLLPMFVCMGLFIIVCGVSVIFANDKNLSISMTLTMIKLFVSSYIVFGAYKNKNTIDDLLKIIMYVGYTLVIVSLVYYGPSTMLSIFRGANTRIDNTLINSNTLGMAAAMSIIINVYYVIYEGLNWYIIMSVPSVFIIAASGSRKSLVLLALGALMISILKNLDNKSFIKKFFKIFITIILLLIIGIVVVKLNVFGEINGRMLGLIAGFTGKGEVDHSTWLRQGYIQLGLEAFQKSPIIGMGIDNARLMTRALYGYDHYLHNNYVELLADVGALGFGTYYLMYIYVLKNEFKLIKIKDRELYVVVTITVILLIMDYGMVSYYAKETYFYLTVIFLKIYQLKNNSNEVIV